MIANEEKPKMIKIFAITPPTISPSRYPFFLFLRTQGNLTSIKAEKAGGRSAFICLWSVKLQPFFAEKYKRRNGGGEGNEEKKVGEE